MADAVADSYVVTDINDDGTIDIHNTTKDSYEVLDINDLLADRKAINEMVEIFNNSVDGREEAFEIWNRVLQVRREQLIVGT